MADTIKELLQERLATVVRIHKAVVEGYTQGVAGITLDDLHQAEVTVQNARLDLCETKQDRIKVHEDMVNEAEQWHKFIEKVAQRGQASPVELLKAKAYLLETRIGLERAKIAA
jgi:outer membrane protein TolC